MPELNDSKKILLAEDDPLILRVYERNFKANGYEVEIALDGEQAIAKLAIMDPKPTLILMDVMMPKFSGFDVLRHIKKTGDLKNIPVVMLTNLSGEEYAQKAIEIGAVTYLVKSQYSAKEVVEKVNELIEAYTMGTIPEVPRTRVLIKDLPSKQKKKKK